MAEEGQRTANAPTPQPRSAQTSRWCSPDPVVRSYADAPYADGRPRAAAPSRRRAIQTAGMLIARYDRVVGLSRELVRRVATRTPRNIRRRLDAVILNLIIGNGDPHAKNFRHLHKDAAIVQGCHRRTGRRICWPHLGGRWVCRCHRTCPGTCRAA